MKTRQFLSALLMVFTTAGFAQVGIGTQMPNSSSMLDVDVTSLTIKKGLLPPRMTEVQRNAIASPEAGLTIYNTTEKCINFYNGAGWVSFCDGGLVDFITKPINYRLGGTSEDRAYSIQQTTDGGYIMAGYTNSSASGDVTGISKGASDVWVIKMKADGTIDWQKNYGGSGSDYAFSIQQTRDGGYILAGATNSSASGDVAGTTRGSYDYWILKLNGSGNIVWEKTYGGSGEDRAYSIQQTRDGGYIVAGETSSSASGEVTGITNGAVDAWIVKLDASGNIAWQKNYGSNVFDHAMTVQQTIDGGYIVQGYTSASGYDVWILKLDTSGNIVWEKTYGGSGDDIAYSIQQTKEGGFIVAGYTTSSASGDMTGTSKGGGDYWILKLLANGSIDWQKNYGGSGEDRAHSIQQTKDGGYIVAGYTFSSASGDVTGTNKGSTDYWILKLNASGGITWQKNYGGTGFDIALYVQQTTDGGYVVTGYSDNESAGNGNQTDLLSRGDTDVWFISLDENGNLLP